MTIQFNSKGAGRKERRSKEKFILEKEGKNDNADETGVIVLVAIST